MSVFTSIANFVRREPACITAVAGAGISVGAAFGLHLSAHQSQEVVGGAAALTGLLIRAKVTPNVSVESRLKAVEAAVAKFLAPTSVPVGSTSTSPAAPAAATSPVPQTQDQLVAFLTSLAQAAVGATAPVAATAPAPAVVASAPIATPTVSVMAPGPVAVVPAVAVQHLA